MRIALVLSVLLLVLSEFVVAQESVNFNVADCAGQMHDLYSELDEGKVVILCWVMPCATCIEPTITSVKVAKNFQKSLPGRVVCYIFDDYGNTSCTPLQSWAAQYGMKANSTTVFFSDKSVRMTDFGVEGMPKIVVMGGSEHKVLYSAENTIDSLQLETAIQHHLSAANTVDELHTSATIEIYPNPSNTELVMHIPFAISSGARVQVVDLHSTLVLQENVSSLGHQTTQNDNTIRLQTAHYPSGSYLLSFVDGTKTVHQRVLIVH